MIGTAKAEAMTAGRRLINPNALYIYKTALLWTLELY